MERMNNIFEKLGRKVSEEDKPYVWAKVAQSVYFCIYGITLLVSYLFRVVGLATFIESYALLRPCLFLALYLYMQFDRTDELGGADRYLAQTERLEARHRLPLRDPT